MKVKECIKDILEEYQDECKFVRLLALTPFGEVFYNAAANKAQISKAANCEVVRVYVKRTGYYKTLFIEVINPRWLPKYKSTVDCKDACERMQNELMEIIDIQNMHAYKQYNMFGGLD